MKIGVIGLGLIGGSIFKRLRKLGYEVIGISRSQKGDNIYSEYEHLKDCNIVFICTPIHTILDVLYKLCSVLTSDTIVTDVASLKEFVTKKSYPFHFIPSHPMAGTEYSGYEHSFEELFEGAKWVLTPFDNSNTAELEDLIKKMGAIPIYAKADEHDRAVALISHTPMLIAQAIFKACEGNDLALKLASSGFRDMTRLAASNCEMAIDMINYNHKNIQNSLLNFYSTVGDLLSDYNENTLSDIAQKRKNMYNNEGKNIL